MALSNQSEEGEDKVALGVFSVAEIPAIGQGPDGKDLVLAFVSIGEYRSDPSL